MQILNLINGIESDIQYNIAYFNDGEVQITLGEFSRKDEVLVKCRITNSEDLFILMQVADILKRHEVLFSISIYYLMGMRMDRVMDFNRPYTLKVVTNILDNLGAYEIHIFKPHSDMSLDMFKNTMCYELYSDKWNDFIYNNLKDFQILLPDNGAVKRWYPDGDVPCDVLVGEKVRDISTGKIISLEISNPEAITGQKIIIFDDLCDGGGTFFGLREAIRNIDENIKVEIVVDHIVNYNGLVNLSKNFNKVYFTNSYTDWNIDDFNNVTKIDIV